MEQNFQDKLKKMTLLELTLPSDERALIESAVPVQWVLHHVSRRSCRSYMYVGHSIRVSDTKHVCTCGDTCTK